MLNEEFDLADPGFLDRAREVREDIEAGEPMSLGEIADRLDMPFEMFAIFLAHTMFETDPAIVAVVVGEPITESFH